MITEHLTKINLVKNIIGLFEFCLLQPVEKSL